MVCNYLLSYPDFNKRFEIYTYANDFQLGAILIIRLYKREIDRFLQYKTYQTSKEVYNDREGAANYGWNFNITQNDINH